MTKDKYQFGILKLVNKNKIKIIKMLKKNNKKNKKKKTKIMLKKLVLKLIKTELKK